MRIALAQVDVALGDVEQNLRTATEVISAATVQGADIAVFPELMLHGYPLVRYDAGLAMPADDERLRRLSADGGPAVIVGFHEDAGPHTYNSAAYLDGGSLVHVHRKLYLPTYDIWEEHKHFS